MNTFWKTDLRLCEYIVCLILIASSTASFCLLIDFVRVLKLLLFERRI